MQGHFESQFQNKILKRCINQYFYFNNRWNYYVKGLAHGDKPAKNDDPTLQFPSALPSFFTCFWLYNPSTLTALILIDLVSSSSRQLFLAQMFSAENNVLINPLYTTCEAFIVIIVITSLYLVVYVVVTMDAIIYRNGIYSVSVYIIKEYGLNLLYLESTLCSVLKSAL